MICSRAVKTSSNVPDNPIQHNAERLQAEVGYNNARSNDNLVVCAKVAVLISRAAHCCDSRANHAVRLQGRFGHQDVWMIFDDGGHVHGVQGLGCTSAC